MIADYIKDIIGKPYKLGRMDCLQLVYGYLEQYMDMPKDFQDITLNNYQDLYNADHKAAFDLLIKFLESILIEVGINEVKTGDIAIVNYKFRGPFPVIVAGNGKAVFVTEEKVMSSYLSNLTIERVFRCQDH